MLSESALMAQPLFAQADVVIKNVQIDKKVSSFFIIFIFLPPFFCADFLIRRSPEKIYIIKFFQFHKNL